MVSNMWCDFECHQNSHKCTYKCGRYMVDEIVYIHIQANLSFDDVIMLFVTLHLILDD